MNIPHGMTEPEVLEIIEGISRALAPKFKFGSNELEDMIQYGVVFGIEGLGGYDPNRGSLKTFLWTHIRNQLFNLKRDKYTRPDKPCIGCQFYDPNYSYSRNQCSKYSDRVECVDYSKWNDRNTSKLNIVNPIEIGNVRDEQEDNMKVFEDITDTLELARAISTVDDEIPIPLRSLWLKLKNEIPLNKADREKLYPVVREILQREGVDGA